MLAITSDSSYSQWHLREPMPISYEEVTEVLYVQADGDELGIIRRLITGIPMHDGRVVRWFGDDARFIVAFLINYY